MTQRTDTPPTWDERTQLATFLDYARDTARAKCEGVSSLMGPGVRREGYRFTGGLSRTAERGHDR